MATGLVLAGMGLALIAGMWGLWRVSLLPHAATCPCEACETDGPE